MKKKLLQKTITAEILALLSVAVIGCNGLNSSNHSNSAIHSATSLNNTNSTATASLSAQASGANGTQGVTANHASNAPQAKRQKVPNINPFEWLLVKDRHSKLSAPLSTAAVQKLSELAALDRKILAKEEKICGIHGGLSMMKWPSCLTGKHDKLEPYLELKQILSNACLSFLPEDISSAGDAAVVVNNTGSENAKTTYKEDKNTEHERKKVERDAKKAEHDKNKIIYFDESRLFGQDCAYAENMVKQSEILKEIAAPKAAE